MYSFYYGLSDIQGREPKLHDFVKKDFVGLYLYIHGSISFKCNN